MEKQKTKSPQSQLSKTDTYEINQTFSFLQSDAHIEFADKHPEVQVNSSEIARRKKAAKEYLPVMVKHFSLYHSPDAVRDLFLKSLVTPSLRMGEWIREDEPVFIAAQAVWLLDYFMNTSKETAFLDLLPDAPANMDDTFEVYFYDTVHSEANVWSTIYLLTERHGKEAEAFSAILKLIEKSTVKKLTQLFETNLFDFFRRAMTLSARADREYDEQIQTVSEQIRGRTFLSPDPIPDFPEKDLIAETFLTHAPELMTDTLEMAMEVLEDRQAAELLLDFGTGDPYNLCTAYLLLCEQGHALAHLNTLTAAVLAYANSRLPFSSEALFIESHIIDKDADADYTMHEIKGYWSDTPDTNPYTDRITYGQALYACADIIPPRTGNISQELVDELQEYGIPEAMAHEIAMITHLFHHTQYRDINFGELLEVSSLEELKRITEPSGEASPAELTPEEKLAAAEKQIDALTQKVIMLQQALSATEREQQKLQKQLETTESSAAADHDELIALRETIFHMQSAEEEPSPDDSITFPYTTTRRICVFGGHDTWRKAIKPMLPEVRFYDRDTLPRPEVIRYADIVWIQPNAISHGNYYSIINAAREHKVPVRYFGYASARKCAEELVGVEKSI